MSIIFKKSGTNKINFRKGGNKKINFFKIPLETDPYINNVSLLMHMDGINGSTTFTDSSSSNLSLSRFGNAQINTSVKKFGTGSALFDGNGDYLSIGSQSAFGFGTGDFTIELWLYALTLSTSDTIILLDMRQTSIYDGVVFNIADIDGVQTLVLYDGSANIPNLRSGIQSSNAVPIGQWTHLVAQRRGTTWSLYIDGILQTNSYSSSGNFGTSRPCTIGSQGINFGPGRFLNGYIDDLRITKGVARYTSTFTPPIQPFPNP